MLPDRRVGGQYALRFDQLHERVRNPTRDRGPVLGEKRVIVRCADIFAERPEEEPEIVELDVRPILVMVRPFGAVAVVPADRDEIRMPDLRLVIAGIGIEHERERSFRLCEMPSADEADDGVTRIAHP